MRIFRLNLVLLVALVFCAPSFGASPSAAQADTPCPNSICKAYLPMIIYIPPIVLISPADGAQVASLAPVLKWQAPFEGIFHIQVSEDSAFSSTSTFALSETKELTLPLPDQIDTLITTNLKPSAVYYWRVEKITSKGQRFAALGHFTTPSDTKALLPPGVPLLAPATKATLPGSSALLQWQSIAGVLYYRVRVYDANNVLFSGSAEVSGATNTLAITGLAPGMTYSWKVKALNAYGWGPFTPSYFFTVP